MSRRLLTCLSVVVILANVTKPGHCDQSQGGVNATEIPSESGRRDKQRAQSEKNEALAVNTIDAALDRNKTQVRGATPEVTEASSDTVKTGKAATKFPYPDYLK